MVSTNSGKSLNVAAECDPLMKTKKSFINFVFCQYMRHAAFACLHILSRLVLTPPPANKFELVILAKIN